MGKVVIRYWCALILGLGLAASWFSPAGAARRVLELSRPATITATHALPAEAGKPPRVVIALAPGNAPVTREASLPLFSPPAPVRPAAQTHAPDVIGALIA